MQIYHINWLQLWKKLTIIFLIVIASAIAAIILWRYFSDGFDYNLTFQYVKPYKLILLLFIICAAGSIFMLLYSLLSRMYVVKIDNYIISGRSYWFSKRSFSLNEIESLEYIINFGATGYIIKSKYNGNLFIPSQVNSFKWLFEIINKSILENNKKKSFFKY